jgi:hypothetical protein
LFVCELRGVMIWLFKAIAPLGEITSQFYN